MEHFASFSSARTNPKGTACVTKVTRRRMERKKVMLLLDSLVRVIRGAWKKFHRGNNMVFTEYGYW